MCEVLPSDYEGQRRQDYEKFAEVLLNTRLQKATDRNRLMDHLHSTAEKSSCSNTASHETIFPDESLISSFHLRSEGQDGEVLSEQSTEGDVKTRGGGDKPERQRQRRSAVRQSLRVGSDPDPTKTLDLYLPLIDASCRQGTQLHLRQSSREDKNNSTSV
ncbi:hypothetical protein YC2023_012610 [Brassica napus]